MKRVMIGTPAHDGRTDVWYNHSLNETNKLAPKHDVDVVTIYMSYDSLIQRARNDLVRLALEAKVDDLIFIDGDQSWNPEWVFKLLDHPVDVVGGAVPKKTDRELYNVRAAALPIPVDMSTGLLRVDGLGTGFLRLSRKALQVLWDGSEEYRNEGRVSRWIFDVRPINGELVGEDFIACEKLRAAGIPVYLDKSMTCGHIGVKTYTGDFAKWLKDVESERAVA